MCVACAEGPDRHDLPSEAIKNHRSLNLHPQHTQLGHIKVPHLIRFGWMLDVLGSLAHAPSPWTLRSHKFFLKDPTHRAPTDLDTTPDDVSRNGACAEPGFRAQPSHLLNQPPHALVQLVPGRAANAALPFEVGVQFSQPGSDGVGMSAAERSAPRVRCFC